MWQELIESNVTPITAVRSKFQKSSRGAVTFTSYVITLDCEHDLLSSTWCSVIGSTSSTARRDTQQQSKTPTRHTEKNTKKRAKGTKKRHGEKREDATNKIEKKNENKTKREEKKGKEMKKKHEVTGKMVVKNIGHPTTSKKRKKQMGRTYYA